MSPHLACLALLVLIPAASAGQPAKYVRPNLLIEPADLAKPEAAKKFRVLDSRPKAKYQAGHIPGASWVDHAAWSKAFNADPDAENWARRIGGAGVGSADQPVVVYGDDP